jgi:ketosteroid isomerase-like protein
VIDHLTAAQNAHDLEAMLACFHEDYRSEQPTFPARSFRGIDQMRKCWSALFASIADLHAEIVRSAATGDTVVHRDSLNGNQSGRTPFEEHGVIIMGIRDDRIAWGRLYADEVQ